MRPHWILNRHDIAYLDEIAETIIPTTDTPGAKAAGVGTFMTVMVKDCYDEKNQKIFLEGMTKLDEASRKMHDKSFTSATPEQRKALLITLDTEQKEYNKNKKKEDPRTLLRTDEAIDTAGLFHFRESAQRKALRYQAIPGRYDGCLPYKKGDKAWAT